MNRARWWTGLLYGATLLWTVPDTRVDGTHLYPEDISHYELFLDGKFRLETTKTKMRVYRYGHYRVRAVAKDGVDGLFSNEVFVDRDGAYVEDDYGSPPGEMQIGIE